MIGKKNIVTIAKHVLGKSQGVPDMRVMHPGREWMTGLLVAVLVFACAALYAGFEFYTQLRNTEERIVVDTTVVEYKNRSAKEILEYYERRDELFSSLRRERVFVPAQTEEEVGEPEEVAEDEGEQ